jgi:acetamidase/formamidase
VKQTNRTARIALALAVAGAEPGDVLKVSILRRRWA